MNKIKVCDAKTGAPKIKVGIHTGCQINTKKTTKNDEVNTR
jgi:hypothetical protein